MVALPSNPPLSGQNNGFTLVELVMAVAILSGAFLTILDLRVKALDDAFKYNNDRLVNRVARQKLDEVSYGLEENSSGEIEIPGKNTPEPWRWSVTIQDQSNTEFGPRLLFIELTLEYPSVYSNSSSEDDLETVIIATRVLVNEENPLYTNAEPTSDSLNNGGF